MLDNFFRTKNIFSKYIKYDRIQLKTSVRFVLVNISEKFLPVAVIADNFTSCIFYEKIFKNFFFKTTRQRFLIAFYQISQIFIKLFCLQKSYLG